jgi:secreted trypsin-like serine protease
MQIAVKRFGKIIFLAGGSSTSPNEYTSMAGLVDFIERRIYCGATVSECVTFKIRLAYSAISSLSVSASYSITAAHCRSGRSISKLGLIVGEHDTDRGSDSNFTVLARISEFLPHSGFNQRTNEHDIALVKVVNPLTFNKGVQPACLPFGLSSTSLVSRSVQAVGW